MDPVQRRGRRHHGGRGRRMKIERVDSFTHAFVGMVRVICDDGMAAIPNAGAYLAYSIEPDSYYPWQAGLYEPAQRVSDGQATIPPGPGWGGAVRSEGLENAAHQATHA
jgi:hypothetical protein